MRSDSFEGYSSSQKFTNIFSFRNINKFWKQFSLIKTEIKIGTSNEQIFFLMMLMFALSCQYWEMDWPGTHNGGSKNLNPKVMQSSLALSQSFVQIM